MQRLGGGFPFIDLAACGKRRGECQTRRLIEVNTRWLAHPIQRETAFAWTTLASRSASDRREKPQQISEVVPLLPTVTE